MSEKEHLRYFILFKIPKTDDERKRVKALKKLYTPLVDWWGKLRPSIFSHVFLYKFFNFKG